MNEESLVKSQAVRPMVTDDMTKSDIFALIVKHKRDLEKFLGEPRTAVCKIVAEYCGRDLHNVLRKEREINSVIRNLEWELKKRNDDGRGIKTLDIEAMRKNISILDVISSCVNMASYRPNANMRCPFPGHEEKTASFHIYPNTNTCKCFGCGRGGSNIDFLIEFYRIDIKGALDMLSKF